MNNRIGVTMMGPYGLKANNYRNARFGAAVSSIQTVSAKDSGVKKMRKKITCEFNLARVLEDNSFRLVKDPRLQLKFC